MEVLTWASFEQFKADCGNMNYTAVANMGHGVNELALKHFTGEMPEHQ